MIKPKETYKPTNLTESLIITVRFSETDPLGIVWHGNYIKYFEDGREAFGKKYGISYLDVEQYGYATPIIKTVCEHKKMVRYGEQLLIVTQYMATAAAKLIFQYNIYNQANELVCTGESIQVFTSLEDHTLSFYKPDFLIKWEKRLLLN
ncbi:thioesterase family protein [Capnocytophaga sp. oral taxon 878]|uniref:acyl-CoA thioesterase n=1 Tax=Capnocytophaga sp. oral taxon 878 TaxID=1316596 RepID=UPI000D04383F|nr:acyl-CoA thioesterase [Capnocytophaga sp. oral taxon 878]AVM49216.1 4-hydroxybenzoyl-CoA thioesterase [Capnocytophaga sp. oral taxon 878]